MRAAANTLSFGTLVGTNRLRMSVSPDPLSLEVRHDYVYIDFGSLPESKYTLGGLIQCVKHVEEWHFSKDSVRKKRTIRVNNA